MKKCEMCKNPKESKQLCGHCGELLGSFDGTVICGADSGEAGGCYVTKKYFAFRAQKNSGIMWIINIVIWQVFGIIAGIITDIFMGGATRDRYGFVDMNDIHVIVVQEITGKKSFFGTFGFKIVLKDGREIVVNNIAAKSYDEAMRILSQTGVKIVMATEMEIVCSRPYLERTIDIKDSVCASAGAFVKLHKKQRILPPVQNLLSPDVQ